MKTLTEIWPDLLMQSEKYGNSGSVTDNLVIWYPKNSNSPFEDFITLYHDQIIARSYNKSMQFKLSTILHNITDRAFIFETTSTISIKGIVISTITVLANEYIDSLNKSKS